MKITNRAAGVLVASAFLVTCCWAAEPTPEKAAPAAKATSATDLFPDQVVAKGKGVEVKRSRLDEELVSIKATAAARGQTIPAEQMNLIERQILERLIHIQLLNNRATDADKAAGKENAEKRLAEIRKRAGTEENLNLQLKSVGTSMPELTRKLNEELTAETVLERELKVNVTDADVKKFYDENPAKFEQPEMVRASHILIGTRDSAGGEMAEDKKAEKKKQAEALLKQARAGEDFAKLAKEHSEDPGSKDTGGEYTFPRGRMVPEFETTAFNLKTNEISDLVTTQFGYHIIKLHEKIPAQTVELEKVESNIRDYLKGQAVQSSLPAHMTKLKDEAGVEVLDERLKPKAPSELAPPPAPAK